MSSSSVTGSLLILICVVMVLFLLVLVSLSGNTRTIRDPRAESIFILRDSHISFRTPEDPEQVGTYDPQELFVFVEL
jgi:hypothetical protein